MRVVYDDNTTGIINVEGGQSFNMTEHSSFYEIFIGGQQGYYVDMLFFKKAPEGDFKTWLENNCRRIL